MRVFVCFLFLFITRLIANPSGAEVISGNVEISTNAQALQVQATDKAIIHWKDFSIAEHEITSFIQPDANASVLNRVVGDHLSSIMGKLHANGHVLLINQNGIIMSENAHIDTGAFTASTLDVLNEDYLKGKELLFSGESNHPIINLGVIEAREGNVFLASFQIDNQGEILAPKGTCGLGISHEVLLQPEEETKIFIRPKKTIETAETGLNNSGVIKAFRVELLADGNPYEYAVQHSGKVHAKDLVYKGGKVLLQAEEGTVYVTGEVFSQNAEETGGEIHILGEKIALFDGAKIDSSGKLGGGEILIGGDRQGENPDVLNAEFVYVEKGVEISSRAHERGDAGKVVFWADGYTRMYGHVDARGGDQGGNGAFVEVSGKKAFDFSGIVDRRAPFGKPGELLLDPESDITVTTAVTSGGAFSAGPPFFFMPSAATSNIDNADIDTNWALGDVTIDTSLGVGGAPFGGRITISDPISPGNFATTLTFRASEDCNCNADISNESGTVNFIAGNDINVDNAARIDVMQANFTATRDIFVNNGVLIIPDTSFVDGFTFTGRDLNLTSTGATTRIGNQNGGNPAINVSRDLNINSTGGGIAQVFILSSAIGTGDLFVGRNMTVFEDAGSNASFLWAVNLPSDSFEVGGDLNITGGNLRLTVSDKTARIGGNLNISQGGTLQHNDINVEPGILRVEAQNIFVDNGTIEMQSGAERLDLIAEDSISFINGSVLDGPFSTTAEINIVVDNAFATEPGIGPGSFTSDGTFTYVFPGPDTTLRIFTAARSQNTQLGTFDGAAFVPGPFNVDSDSEIWSTYFPSTLGTGMPVTFFYKEPAAVILNPVTQQSFVAQTELLNTFFFEEELISIYQQYTTQAGGHEVPFIMRLRNYGTDITRQVGEVLPK